MVRAKVKEWSRHAHSRLAIPFRNPIALIENTGGRLNPLCVSVQLATLWLVFAEYKVGFVLLIFIVFGFIASGIIRTRSM